jgi:hypothetical protein
MNKIGVEISTLNWRVVNQVIILSKNFNFSIDYD